MEMGWRWRWDHLDDIEGACAGLEACLVKGKPDVHVLLVLEALGLGAWALWGELLVRLVADDRDEKIMALTRGACACVPPLRLELRSVIRRDDGDGNRCRMQ